MGEQMNKEEEILKELPSMLSSSGCCYIQFNSGYDLIYSSPYWYQYTGYTKEEYKIECQNKVSSIVHPDDLQKMKASIARQLSMGSYFKFEFRCITKNKAIRWAHIRGICKAKNNQMVYSAIAYDITESKESYKELLSAKTDLDLIAYQLDGGIVKLDAEDFRVFYANEGFYRLAGYSKSEYESRYGNNYALSIYPEDLEELKSVIRKSSKEHNKFTVEHRIIHKDGSIRWVRNTGNYLDEYINSPALFCIITDVTESKSHEEALIFEQKKHELLCSLNHEYLWEYDPETKILLRNGDLENSYSMDTVLPDGFDYPIDKGFVHPEDANKIKNLLRKIKNASANVSLDIRMKDNNGNYVWYKIQAVALKNSKGGVTRIIGKTTNINSIIKQIEFLKDEAQKDSLTHLYSRNATEEKINESLKNKTIAQDSALILVDIKGCKSMQEKYGQLFTDSVIHEASEKVTKIFPNAIIGRTSFDVFTIFIPLSDSKDKIKELVEETGKQIRSIETGQENEISICCHIGIATSNEPNDSFAAIFKKADMALFYAKDTDNEYEFFGKNADEINTDNLEKLEIAESKVTSSKTRRTSLRKFIWASEDYSFMSDIMGILNREDNVPNAIHQVLEKVSLYYNAEHVMITEYVPGENISKITYTYYSPDSHETLEPLHTLPLDKVREYEKLFNQQGFFYTNNLKDIERCSPYLYELMQYSKIRSLLNCAFERDKKFGGFLFIGDFKKKRIWRDKELNLIKSITDIINYVLIRYNREQSQLYNQSTDSISGLPSFSYFLTEGNRLLNKTKEVNKINGTNKKLALASMDIEKFHLYNSNYGFSVGNKVLYNMASRLQGFIESNELCSRLQGDLFYMLLQYDSLEQLEARISSFFSERSKKQMNLPDYSKFVISCGIYLIENNDMDISTLIDKVDYARQTSKNLKESNSYSIYSSNLGEKYDMESNIHNNIKKALINREITILFQPKYDLLSDRMCGAEALVRWNGQDGRQIFPDVILPILQQERLAADLDFYVIEEVCQRLASIRDKNKKMYPVSIGLSTVHLQNFEFVEQLMDILSAYQIESRYIQFEIEEKSFLDESDAIGPFLKILHERGFKLILSHFGSINGSLDTLVRFPVDVVKFDISYFRSHIENDRTKILLQKIIETAHSMGQKVATVGLESELQKSFLSSIGCDYIQGYLYHKPLPPEAFEKYLCGDA